MRVRALSSFLLVLPALVLAAETPQGTVPITTSSAEARELYLQARDLSERLKGTEANKVFAKAVEKDPQCAMAWLQLAFTSGTAKEFQNGLNKAVALADKVSEGERLLILSTKAANDSKPAEQRRMLDELVRKFPNDPRVHLQLGNVLFAQQDYDGAIRELSRSAELDPKFSQPYNQLGYAYRFKGNNAEAEKAFVKYAELIPDDPNPHDSYAELLMRLGRFDESITRYRKALSIDPHFLSAYIGIANDQIFLGKGDEARKTLTEMQSKARTDGERRLALFWMSQTYAHEGRWAEAIKSLEDEKKIADAAGDIVSASQDINFIGDLLLGAGKPAEAAGRFEESVKMLGKAKVSDDIKEAGRRAHLFDMGRVALRKGDLADAREYSAKYTAAVAARKVPFEVRQAHELAGMLAVQAKDWDTALKELPQASQQNPRVLYFTGLAWQGKGDATRATEAFKATVDFNQLSGVLPFVRADARRQLARS